MPLVYERVKNVREVRLASKAAAIRKFADMPTRFAQITQPEGVDFILIPRVSSERRQYVPMGFMSGEIKVTDAVQIIPNATLYHFGVLTSSLHMTWLRTVCGRLESRYRYSKDVVYNNFIWKEPTDKQKQAIETSAQAILDVRAKYRDEALGTRDVVGKSKLVPSPYVPTSLKRATLADLYDELTMPADLRRAHKKNDRAVAVAYGLENILDDGPTLAVELLKLYEKYARA